MALLDRFFNQNKAEPKPDEQANRATQEWQALVEEQRQRQTFVPAAKFDGSEKIDAPRTRVTEQQAPEQPQVQQPAQSKGYSLELVPIDKSPDPARESRSKYDQQRQMEAGAEYLKQAEPENRAADWRSRLQSQVSSKGEDRAPQDVREYARETRRSINETQRLAETKQQDRSAGLQLE